MDMRIDGPQTLAVSFDPADACFNGHFPGNPVVPGTLILGLCLEAARRRLGRDALTVRRFSFSRFAGPGDYELRIEEHGADLLCTFGRGETVFAKGRIGT